ncbi:hypothetical protein B0H17DRAFT_396461 [Mycena rosella]|uniref:NACHT domain-containing protein n=1 Tax=Mycena rosella TaxID=1033263 RepID=A0AAD7CML4_MYCRO|nr:hypothetical protein B0H17DRAFT_396461 [Mycena rosella]
MKDALSRLDKLTTLETQTIVAETRTVVAETQTVVAETQITAAEILVGVKALESSGQFDRVAISSLESKVVKLLDMQVVRDIKSWLSAPDPSTSHSNVLKTRHRGTGSWFLEGKTFADWKTSNNSVFWIYGSPGSGKSVLCSSIIDMLAPTSSLAYFYCDFRDTQTQNARGLLSSLVSQLSVVSSESLDILRRVHRDNSGVPNGALLFASLSEMSDVSGDVFIIIDALDECTGSAERAEILEYLERLVKLDRPQLHVLVASRPEADIQSCMMRMKTHQLDLQAVEEQAEDLRLYVSYQLEKMKWDNILVLAAFDKLTAKANGSYVQFHF